MKKTKIILLFCLVCLVCIGAFTLVGCQSQLSTHTPEREAQEKAIKERAQAMADAMEVSAGQTKEAIEKMKVQQASATSQEEKDAYTVEIAKYETVYTNQLAVIQNAHQMIMDAEKFLQESKDGTNRNVGEKMKDVGKAAMDGGKAVGGVPGAITWGIGAVLTGIGYFGGGKIQKRVNAVTAAAKQASFSDLVNSFQKVLNTTPPDTELARWIEREPDPAIRAKLIQFINEAVMSKEDIKALLEASQSTKTQNEIAQTKAALKVAGQQAAVIAGATTGKVQTAFSKIESVLGVAEKQTETASVAVDVITSVVPNTVS